MTEDFFSESKGFAMHSKRPCRLAFERPLSITSSLSDGKRIFAAKAARAAFQA